MGFWVEVRPLSVGEFEPGNLRGLLESLINSGKPFRIFLVASESPTVPGRRVVRFWVELPTPELKEYVARSLRTYLDVEVLDSQPPRRSYPRCAEYELKRHYAIPIWPLGQRMQHNPVDAIVGALATGNGALEIIAAGDLGAKMGIYNFIFERLNPKGRFTREMMDGLLGIIAEVGIEQYEREISRQAWWEWGRQWRQRDPQVRADVEAAARKLQQPLATCKIRIYGDPATVQMVQSAIPAGANRLLRWKTKRNTVAPEAKLKKPGRFRFRNLAAKLWFLIPAGLLLVAWRYGYFTLTLGKTDIYVLAGICLIASGLALTARKVKPIVLSAEELAAIASLPTAVGRLPLEFGVAPPARKPMPKEESRETLAEEVKPLATVGGEEAGATAPYWETPEEAEYNESEVSQQA